MLYDPTKQPKRVEVVLNCPRCSGEGRSRQLVSGVSSNDPNAEFAQFECEACDGKGWHMAETTDDADGKSEDVLRDLATDAVNAVIGYDWSFWAREARS